ncbi:MAG: transcriptional regulator, BadM/Rrf2 family [Chloroflexi bacterium]|nr:transcriptional regulator, BadM/Rrf2 family [Chloroflexota bacterium]
MKAQYAARAAVDLAERYEMGPVRSQDIAKRQQINEPFLDQIMTLLRKAGLVRSTRGPHGGHELARPPSTLTLKDVVEAVQVPISRTPDGRQGAVLQDVWDELAEVCDGVLGSATLERLVQRKRQLDARAAYHI